MPPQLCVACGKAQATTTLLHPDPEFSGSPHCEPCAAEFRRFTNSEAARQARDGLAQQIAEQFADLLSFPEAHNDACYDLSIKLSMLPCRECFVAGMAEQIKDVAERIGDTIITEIRNRPRQHCSWCEQEPLPGSRACGMHLKDYQEFVEWDSERGKRKYAVRKANGLCVKCGQPAQPGRVRCEACGEVAREASRIRRILYAAPMKNGRA